MSDGDGLFCIHWYVGVGFPSPRHSKLVEEKSVAVFTRSLPILTILGGSERTHDENNKNTFLYLNKQIEICAGFSQTNLNQ